MKKIFALSILLILVLSACGGGDGGQKVVRMWVHTNNAFIAGYETIIAAYEAEHPDVDIQLENFDYELYLQTLQTAMPAGEEADILQLFGTWTSQYYERLAPVPAEVMTIAEAEELFYAAPIGGYIVDGVLYGMPQEFNMEYGGVLVNKTKYEAAGLTYPPQWETLDDVLADALALVVNDDAGMMATAGFHFTSADPISASFLAGIRQRGGDYWNADHTGFTFNTPEAKAQLQWMLDAVTAGAVDPVVFNDSTNFVIDAFFQGKVGIGYIGAWAIAEGQANFPDFTDEWDYFYLPPVEGDPVFVADSGWGLTVSPNSENQDVAWDFVKFVTADPENATGLEHRQRHHPCHASRGGIRRDRRSHAVGAQGARHPALRTVPGQHARPRPGDVRDHLPAHPERPAGRGDRRPGSGSHRHRSQFHF